MNANKQQAKNQADGVSSHSPNETEEASSMMAQLATKTQKHRMHQPLGLLGASAKGRGAADLEQTFQPTSGGKTDFMKTQKFHRRNLSNLVKMKEEADVPDHMLISRGGPPRRTLEQIEQDNKFAYGTEEDERDSSRKDSTNKRRQNQHGQSCLTGEEPESYDEDVYGEDYEEDSGLGQAAQGTYQESKEVQMPKDGFIDMVEQPSVADDDYEDDLDFAADADQSLGVEEQFINNMREPSNEEASEGDEQNDGEYPMTGRRGNQDNQLLNSASKDSHQLREQLLQGDRDHKMELSELLLQEKTNNETQRNKQSAPTMATMGANNSCSTTVHDQNQITRRGAQGDQFATRNSPTAEISQATNESCSSLDTAGQGNTSYSPQPHTHQLQDQRRASSSLEAPNEAYGAASSSAANHRKQPSAPRGHQQAPNLHVYQYYSNTDDEVDEEVKRGERRDSYQSDGKSEDEPTGQADESSLSVYGEAGLNEASSSRLIDTASPSPAKGAKGAKLNTVKPKFQLQIEIDSEESDAREGTGEWGTAPGGSRHPPSAPKQGNFIQFEEVRDAAAEAHDDFGLGANHGALIGVRPEDAYELYGAANGMAADSALSCDLAPGQKPGLPGLDTQQKTRTPKEQIQNTSYFPNDAAILKAALPSTKSYQTPINLSAGLAQAANTAVSNPFLPEGGGDSAPTPGSKQAHFRTSMNLQGYEDSNSVSTANPQHYYYHMPNGQIGFGQNSQSRASDRIYDKAQTSQGHSPEESSQSNRISDRHQEGDDRQGQNQDTGAQQRLDNEIRRLEELNRIDAQRLREPLTTDESPQPESPTRDLNEEELHHLQEAETRANCPDEYNLLSGTGSLQEHLDSVEALKNTSRSDKRAVEGQSMDANCVARETQVEDFNDRESACSGSAELSQPVGQPSGAAGSNVSLGTSATNERQSRRLYVITEESGSHAGPPTLDPSRESQQVNSGPNLQASLGPAFLRASTNSEQQIPLLAQQESDPKQRRLTQGSSRASAEGRRSLLLESSAAAPAYQELNAIGANQGVAAQSQYSKDQDAMRAYLKQSSTLSIPPAEKRLHSQANSVGKESQILVQGGSEAAAGLRGVEMGSDEDLLGSNFDRISRVLPNHEQINEQLPDFHCNEPASRQTTPTELVEASGQQVEALLNENRDLRQMIKQREEVIMIKDNTIADLKSEYGLRSSLAGLTATKPDEHVKDVAVLALPDTRDVKCQTHGPRKQAYYRSIPAKVFTNLQHRSPSTSQERLDISTTILYPQDKETRDRSCGNAMVRSDSLTHKHKSKRAQGNSPGKGGSKQRMMQDKQGAFSNSYSPSRRRQSPAPGKGMSREITRQGSQTLEQARTIDDIRSLRIQLTSLKKQLGSQEQDNMTLIEKVTQLEDTIETQEKNYDSLQLELEDRIVQNATLVEQNDELIKQVDSLMADNAELRQTKSLSLKSEQLQRLLQEAKERVETADLAIQTEDVWVQTPVAAGQRQAPFSNDTSHILADITQNTPDGMTAGVTSSRSQTQIVNSSGLPYHNGALGAGLMPVMHTSGIQGTNSVQHTQVHNNSRVLDQLSDVLSGEQPNVGGRYEAEKVQVLQERASTYEQQQARIEAEIEQYRRLINEVQLSQVPSAPHLGNNQSVSGPKPFNLHSQEHQLQVQDNASGRNQHHMRVQSTLSQVSASPNLNLVDGSQQRIFAHPQHLDMSGQQDLLVQTGPLSFELNKNSSQNLASSAAFVQPPHPYALHQATRAELHTCPTGHNTATSAGLVSLAGVAHSNQVAHLANKLYHHKKKGKKLAKRNQKLEFEKLAADKTIQEMHMKMSELNERYRDLRAKYQLKLQEKAIKISELKSQLHQRLSTPMQQAGPPTGVNSSCVHSLPPFQATQTVHPSQMLLQNQALVNQTHITSHEELSSTQPHNHLTPIHSNEKTLTVPGAALQVQANENHNQNYENTQHLVTQLTTAQEDNKGQRESQLRKHKDTASAVAQLQAHQVQPQAQSVMPVQSQEVSAVNMQLDRSSLGLSNQGDFYQLVSSLVDQRMAEHSVDQERHSDLVEEGGRKAPNKGKDPGQPIDSQEFVVREHRFVSNQAHSRAKKKHSTNHGERRDDLEILKDKRKLLTEQADNLMPTPSELDRSQTNNLVESEATEQAATRPQESLYTPQLNQAEIEAARAWLHKQHLMGQQEATQHYRPRESHNYVVLDPESASAADQSPNETLAESYARSRSRRQTARNEENRNYNMPSPTPPASNKNLYRQARTQSSPNKANQGRNTARYEAKRPGSKSKSSQRSRQQVMARDQSLKRGVSKDDVMPCYKYKVEGRKRNQVEHNPSVSLLTYLQLGPHSQAPDENASSTGNHPIGRAYRSGSSSPSRKHHKPYYPSNQRSSLKKKHYYAVESPEVDRSSYYY